MHADQPISVLNCKLRQLMAMVSSTSLPEAEWSRRAGKRWPPPISSPVACRLLTYAELADR